jgi:flagellar biosynthetic protein FliR
MEGGLGRIVDFFQAEELNQVVLIGMLIFFRVIPVIFVTPFLGGKLVPPTTKTGLAMGFSILLYPFATAGMVAPMYPNPIVFIVLMLKELFIGFTLGYVAAEIFYAMEIGGRMLDVMRGSNMAEVQVPELNLRASPVGDFLLQLLLIVFLGLGGHRFFIEAFCESFALVPVDGWPRMSGHFDEVVLQIMRFTGDLFAIAFALVFPGIFATFMTDVVFGMLNRVAPQLNAYFMAMGVKALGGLALLFFSLALVTQRMGWISEHSTIFVRDLVKLFG